MSSILLWNPSVMPLLRVKRHKATISSSACGSAVYTHPPVRCTVHNRAEADRAWDVGSRTRRSSEIAKAFDFKNGRRFHFRATGKFKPCDFLGSKENFGA